MSNNLDLELLRHDTRRGEIIRILKQDYPHPIPFRVIQLALRDGNYPIGQRDLFTYLTYLEEGGYIRCVHGYDENESQDLIIAAALTNKGLQLHDRRISDPGVRF